jgi:glutathione S-transferase
MSAATRATMTERPILFSFRRCPYAMRARMAIAVSGVTVTLREVVLRDKPEALIAASPKATVPVLLLPGGEVIDESLAIMRWALAQHDPSNWLAGGDPGLIDIFDGPFKAALDRYKYPHRFDISDATPQRKSGLAQLAALEPLLQRQAHIGGEVPGLADIAIFPFVRQFAATEPAWFAAQPLPALHRWLASVAGAPLFTAVMQKYPKWQPGDADTPFP